MVGKSNLVHDGYQRPELKGSSTTTPGLTALDQEREASMADEGGVSGAQAEAEADNETLRYPPLRRPAWGLVLAAAALGAVVYFIAGPKVLQR